MGFFERPATRAVKRAIKKSMKLIPKPRLKSQLKILPFVTLMAVAFLTATFSYAQTDRETYSSTTSRVGFFLGGGFAHSESRGGMIDLKSELQFSLSKEIRLGLGIGYLSDFHGMHMSGGMMGGMNNGSSGHNHSFQVVPITLSIYYLLPLSPKVDVFMAGGGGYYIASFRDVSTENKNAFGPHVGIGFDFKVAHKVSIITEAVYRFVNLKDFTSQLHQGFRELDGGAT